MDKLTKVDVDAGVVVKSASEKKRNHDEKQQALNYMTCLSSAQSLRVTIQQ